MTQPSKHVEPWGGRFNLICLLAGPIGFLPLAIAVYDELMPAWVLLLPIWLFAWALWEAHKAIRATQAQQQKEASVPDREEARSSGSARHCEPSRNESEVSSSTSDVTSPTDQIRFRANQTESGKP